MTLVNILNFKYNFPLFTIEDVVVIIKYYFNYTIKIVITMI